MISLNEAVSEYTLQLSAGKIQCAYRGIIHFMSELKFYLEKIYPQYIPGKLYAGYLDMTYFPRTPAPLKKKGLKIAVVYLHEQNRIKVWLAAANRKIQSEYHHLLKHQNYLKGILAAKLRRGSIPLSHRRS
jgi:hypothetical protein